MSDNAASRTVAQCPQFERSLPLLAPYETAVGLYHLPPGYPRYPQVLRSEVCIRFSSGLALKLCASMTAGPELDDTYVALASPCCWEIGGEIWEDESIGPYPHCGECDEPYSRFAASSGLGLWLGREPEDRLRDLAMLENWLSHYHSALDTLTLSLHAQDLLTTLRGIAVEERDRLLPLLPLEPTPNFPF